jgi:membrane protein
MKSFLSKCGYLLKHTTLEFIKDNALKLSASLSYYTIFSIPPLLIIIISVLGFVFGPAAIKGELFSQINGIVGNDAAAEIQRSIANINLSGRNGFVTTIGVVILLIGASGVFSEVQSSINYIWGIEAKPKRGLVKFLKNRLMSFSMIGSVGFLLMVSLVVNTLLDILRNRLSSRFPEIAVYFFYVFNVLIVFATTALLFTIIFRTLPDGKISRKDSVVGASFTTVLFMVGKFLIAGYLGNSQVASVYGAAGSVILILVWVYYSAIILYFGAEFTKVYAQLHGEKIIPNEYSIQIRKDRPEIKAEM